MDIANRGVVGGGEQGFCRCRGSSRQVEEEEHGQDNGEQAGVHARQLGCTWWQLSPAQVKVANFLNLCSH